MPWYAPDSLLDEVGGMRFKNAAQSMLDDFKQGLTGSSSSDAATPTPAPPAAPEPVQQPLISASAPSVPSASSGQAATSTGRATDQQPGSFLPSAADLTAGWGAPAGTSAATSSSGASGSQSTASSTADPGQSDANQPGSFLPTMDALAGGWMQLLPPKDQASVAQTTGMTPAKKVAPLTPSGTPEPMPEGGSQSTSRPAPRLSTGQEIHPVYVDGRTGQPVSGDIVGGNPQDFIRTAGPVAAQVEANTGGRVPAKLIVAMAANETGWGNPQYVVGNNYHGIHAQAGEPTVMSTDRDAQGHPYAVGFRKFDSPAAGFQGFADFLLNNPRYSSALDQYQKDGDLNALITNIAVPHTVNGQVQGGYAEDPGYAGKVQALMQQIPNDALKAPSPAAPARTAQSQPPGPVGIADGKDWRQTWGDNLTPDQIKETLALGLDWNAAIATCGIAAAVAFARANGGEPPTFGQALALAQRSGEWNADVGMTHGTPGEISVLKQLGVDAHQGPLDERSVAQAVQAGQPVQINAKGAGGHFYVAQKYDPETHRFDFGGSTAILKAAGGRTWFRLDELPALGVGTPSEAIYLGAGQ
jgi:flagellum-specific peptidoglycan hydrolase FlgJ